MRPSVLFEHDDQIESMDINKTGDLLCLTSDDTVWVYNTIDAKQVTKIPSKKYGVNCAKFTQKSTVICTSKTGDSTILRHLCIQSNRYLAYFSGHRERIESLSFSKENTFASSARDGTKVWDLRSQKSIGYIPFKGTLEFDPSSKVLAIGSYELKLFDFRMFKEFLSAKTQHVFNLRFSPCGLHLAVTGSRHELFDAFDLDLLLYTPSFKSECDFVNSKFVASYGLRDGILHLQNESWHYIEPECINLVRANHIYEMMCTTSNKTLCFWK